MAKRIAVLGGGVGGVVAAHDLARRGAVVDLYERGPDLGGLHRSVVVDGDAYDIGVFIFGQDHPMFESFPSLLPMFVATSQPHMSVTPNGSLDTYPVSPRGYLRAHGFRRTARGVVDMFAGKFRYRGRDSVADYARFYVGETFYRETGLKHYIERMYGVPDDQVGLEFATQRLSEIRHFLARQIKARLPGVASDDSSYLVRPREGFSQVYQYVAQALRAAGVNMRCGAEISAVRRTAHGFEVECAPSGGEYDEVISTIPVASLARLVGRPGTSTEHIGLLSLFYRGNLLAPGAALYNFTFAGKWKRMCAFSRYYGQSRDADYITVEATCKDTSEARRREVIEDFEAHTESLSIFRGRPECVGYASTTTAYPLFRPENALARVAELDHLRSMGFRLLGRQGAQQYISSHHVARQARQLAAVIQVA